MSAESTTLAAARAGEEEAAATARTHLHAINETVNAVDADLTRLTEEMAAGEARRAAAARRVEETQMRLQRLKRRREELEDQRHKTLAEAVGPNALEEAQSALAQANERAESARTQVETADLRRREAHAALEAHLETLRTKQTAQARRGAEIEALQALLTEAADGEGAPVLDLLTVAPGLELALASALGEDLTAAETESAPRRWTVLPPLSHPPALPNGTKPLSAFVTGPKALARRLSQVGVVEDVAEAAALQSSLHLGQRLVTRDGGLWRWDGFTVAPGSPDAAAALLKQRNRLGELRAEVAALAPDLTQAVALADAARHEAGLAAIAETSARDATREAERTLVQTRENHLRLEQKLAAAQAKLTNLDEALAALSAEVAEPEAHQREAQTALEDGTDLPETRERAAKLRADLAEKRTRLVEARSAYDRLSREAEQRRARQAAIERESQSWNDRSANAARHLSDLADRRGIAEEEAARLAARPAEIEAARHALLGTTEEADIARRGCADALAKAEIAQAEADRALREAEQALGLAREERVRAEGVVEQGKQTCATVAMRIKEQLDCIPEKALAEARLEEGEDIPGLEEAERRLERAQREREAMGPVNLRAEQETAELEEQMSGLRVEKDDLLAAIARLRQAIAELNREGRDRLLASFEEVDRHFRQLFVRLFGGGRAHLALTESEDPLEAGLEIMASPPGKRLQILSLLSGGEQALTALALLFAVFLTNPAPICILDEVDAPLDDANVDRFCTMLKEIAESSQTRFLCVTHHRMTMARMDRLFGVTMAERGVSRLVSVDLQRAAELAETA